MSKIEEEVISKIKRRAEFGLKKYGVSMERDDLTEIQWLQHLQDELMDGAVYVQRIMDDLYRIQDDLK
jgi:hypothetical protein